MTSARAGLKQLLFVAAGCCPMSVLLHRLGAADLRDAGPASPLVTSRR